MTKDVIEIYDTFNTKVFPDELIFGNFNDKPIPSTYYNLINDDNRNGYNNPGTPFEYSLLENKGVEYTVHPNDEYINYEIIIIYYINSLASDIQPPQN